MQGLRERILSAIPFLFEYMLIEQPPKIFRMLYPDAMWRIPQKNKTVYLTFDDGPIPDITPWVTDLLEHYGVKATFFLVGDNVRKHPQEFQLLKDMGHTVGNHTFNHLQGFKFTAEEYMANINKADELIHSPLFRPPHGHLTFRQYNLIRQHYKIVMWDLVTRDYSRRQNERQVFANVERYVRNGSIITFHDSIKAEKNMKYALPKTIEMLLEEGYSFDTL